MIMELKGGKFFSNGVEVPIEIGNREQIELLNKRAKLMEKGLPIDVQIHEVTTYTLSLKWACPHCDKINVYCELDTQEDDTALYYSPIHKLFQFIHSRLMQKESL